MKRKAKEETPFMRNGRMLLEGLIAFGNGKSNPIHIFSAEELRRATNNYDQCRHFLLASDFDFYKGSLEDYLISVKNIGKSSNIEGKVVACKIVYEGNYAILKKIRIRKTKAQLKFVKSYREGLQMENYFENESGIGGEDEILFENEEESQRGDTIYEE
ncbi:hypothetical protein SO802_013523 [Lithocarpus litseifolius]|uniref:Uncharacterized protein n=1 Tax=Lithocarpus litseifolius TaxID=425828 RepID=A0AAW2D5T5_9ROSI